MQKIFEIIIVKMTIIVYNTGGEREWRLQRELKVTFSPIWPACLDDFKRDKPKKEDL